MSQAITDSLGFVIAGALSRASMRVRVSFRRRSAVYRLVLLFRRLYCFFVRFLPP